MNIGLELVDFADGEFILDEDISFYENQINFL